MGEMTGLVRIGRLMVRGQGHQAKPKTEDVIMARQRIWEEQSGHPKKIRHAEEGSHISREMGGSPCQRKEAGLAQRRDMLNGSMAIMLQILGASNALLTSVCMLILVRPSIHA